MAARGMNYWATIYKCLWGVAILLLVAVMISFFIPKYRTLCEYRKKRDDLQQTNQRTETMIRDLRRKQEQILSDPAFIERTARESGMVKQDEVVFKFTNSVSRNIVSPRLIN